MINTEYNNIMPSQQFPSVSPELYNKISAIAASMVECAAQRVADLAQESPNRARQILSNDRTRIMRAFETPEQRKKRIAKANECKKNKKMAERLQQAAEPANIETFEQFLQRCSERKKRVQLAEDHRKKRLKAERAMFEEKAPRIGRLFCETVGFTLEQPLY